MTPVRTLFSATLIWALFAPLVVQAQPAVRTWRLGMLTVIDRPTAVATPIYNAFLEEMRALGYRGARIS